MKYLIKLTHTYIHSYTRFRNGKQINVHSIHLAQTSNNKRTLQVEYVAKYILVLVCRIEGTEWTKTFLYSAASIYKVHVYSFLHKILLNRELLRAQTFYQPYNKTKIFIWHLTMNEWILKIDHKYWRTHNKRNWS